MIICLGVYLRGVLTMTSKRTFANITRSIVAPADDGQAWQQFISDSPWFAQSVLAQVQSKLAASPALHPAGMQILDESADAKAGISDDYRISMDELVSKRSRSWPCCWRGSNTAPRN